jgi:hypothetical protein
MNQAIFHPLPAIRLFRGVPNDPSTFQYDEVFAVNRRPHIVRQLSPRWWAQFRHPLPVGTRVEIRHVLNRDHQITWQVIAIEDDSFRVVAYVYGIEQAGPQCDMTADEYQEHILAAVPVAPAALVPIPQLAAVHPVPQLAAVVPEREIASISFEQ